MPKPSKIKVQGSQLSRLNCIFQLHSDWYACADTHTNRLSGQNYEWDRGALMKEHQPWLSLPSKQTSRHNYATYIIGMPLL
ncbi:hypothetical protein C0Q70_12407 [Pomacea canaliculata]|uniref:Uncharacterized protein n=1 Tax=Pomacea canaliculata TaxID=400727 RepID=A0A2T7P1F9_POMCA|nr:hypothetical protein C0Q70_12407 [Pomacea canaliculata]